MKTNRCNKMATSFILIRQKMLNHSSKELQYIMARDVFKPTEDLMKNVYKYLEFLYFLFNEKASYINQK